MTVITDEQGQHAWDKKVRKWLRGKEINQSAGFFFFPRNLRGKKSMENFEMAQGT